MIDIPQIIYSPEGCTDHPLGMLWKPRTMPWAMSKLLRAIGHCRMWCREGEIQDILREISWKWAIWISRPTTRTIVVHVVHSFWTGLVKRRVESEKRNKWWGMWRKLLIYVISMVNLLCLAVGMLMWSHTQKSWVSKNYAKHCTSVTFSVDSTRIISGSDDKSIGKEKYAWQLVWLCAVKSCKCTQVGELIINQNPSCLPYYCTTTLSVWVIKYNIGMRAYYIWHEEWVYWVCCKFFL